MAGRGQQTFNKRQKEQQRKERQQEKLANRIQRKKDGGLSAQLGPEDDESINPLDSIGLENDAADPESGPSPASPHNHP